MQHTESNKFYKFKTKIKFSMVTHFLYLGRKETIKIQINKNIALQTRIHTVNNKNKIMKRRLVF